MQSAKITLIAIFLVTLVACESKGTIQQVSPPGNPDTPESARISWEEEVVPLLDKAQAHHQVAMKESVDVLERLFNVMRDKPVKNFVEEILSYEGKWKALYKSKRSYRKWCTKQFENHIVSKQQLGAAIQEASQILSSAMNSSASNLRIDLIRLVSERHDLKPGDVSLSPPDLDLRVLTDLSKGSAHHGSANLVMGEILALIIQRAMVSAGLFGAGLGTGWATFGVGFAISIIIDLITSSATSKKLRRNIRKELDKVRKSVIEGKTGARARMRAVVKTHEQATERSIRAWIDSLEGGKL